MINEPLVFLQAKLTGYVTGLRNILGDHLLGCYLFGSLARGCYSAATSDVDILTVIAERPAEAAIAEVLQTHRALGIPIDAVFVAKAQLHADIFPATVAFLVKSLAGGPEFHTKEEDRDFLLQRQDVYEAGIALAGPPPRELLRPVPWLLLAESLEFLFPYIVTHFKNSPLMLCRICYAHTHRTLCSKRQAGEWAVAAFDACWKPLLATALNEYAQGISNSALSAETVRQFEAYCAAYLHNLPMAMEHRLPTG